MTQDYRKRAEEFINHQNRLLQNTGQLSFDTEILVLESEFKQIAQEARREENEACWNLAMGATGDTNNVAFAEGYSGACRDIAKAIRSRLGEK